MIRCDKCDGVVEENVKYRTQVGMKSWCMDYRNTSMYESNDSQMASRYADLCSGCQKQLFTRLEQLAQEFTCVVVFSSPTPRDLMDEKKAAQSCEE